MLLGTRQGRQEPGGGAGGIEGNANPCGPLEHLLLFKHFGFATVQCGDAVSESAWTVAGHALRCLKRIMQAAYSAWPDSMMRVALEGREVGP